MTFNNPQPHQDEQKYSHTEEGRTLLQRPRAVLCTRTTQHDSDVMGQVLAMVKEWHRQVISERIKQSLQQRAAKEMYSNGKPPFGFLKFPEEQTLSHDQNKVHIIKRMFEIYVETRSDLKVRDWLKTQAIHSPEGKPEWAIGTIRALLQNVRYIGQIELNRKNKGLSDTSVPDEYQYRIIEATSYGPMISRELWDLAQNIRLEQAQKSLRLAKSHC